MKVTNYIETSIQREQMQEMSLRNGGLNDGRVLSLDITA